MQESYPSFMIQSHELRTRSNLITYRHVIFVFPVVTCEAIKLIEKLQREGESDNNMCQSTNCASHRTRDEPNVRNPIVKC